MLLLLVLWLAVPACRFEDGRRLEPLEEVVLEVDGSQVGPGQAVQCAFTYACTGSYNRKDVSKTARLVHVCMCGVCGR